MTTLAPLTISATRDGLARLAEQSLPEDIDLIQRCYLSDDFSEELTRFLQNEKRTGADSERATKALYADASDRTSCSYYGRPYAE